MEKLAFYIVDVFAEEKYAGNQLAVFRGVKAVSSTEMQRIAKEMNFSETTFILSDENVKADMTSAFLRRKRSCRLLAILRWGPRM